MHWAEEIAQELIRRKPDKEEYVCAAGISPSGSIHIGNFRDVATSLAVVRALRRYGKKAKLLFSWDEFDRLRKVPVNVAERTAGFEENIGRPYVDIADPFDDGHESYAAHFEEEFMRAMERFGIQMDYRRQGELYRSGKYKKYILLALEKRGEIFDILDSHRTQAAVPGEREAYYPVSIYCPVCGRDTTRVTALSEDCRVAAYTCDCGHSDSFNFTTDFNCKLSWKVDWPMRWLYEGVDFEPGGKDHASPNGSYDTGKDIAKAIFGYDAPLFQGYEFIGIKGSTGKMSGSSGLNLTPDTLLKLYQPEVILWLYAKTEPLKAFDFCFDDGILRQYFEFDKMLAEVNNGTANAYTQTVMDYARVGSRVVKPVPMSLLVQLGSIVDFNVPMLEVVFEKIGTPYKYADFQDRLERAKFWLEQCAPENVNRLRETRNWDIYETLSDTEKKELALLHELIQQGGYTLDGLQTAIYAVPSAARGVELDKKALKEAQGAFFKNVYRLLLDREQGPRLYLFLYAIEPEKYLRLLDFSTPKTEAELFVPSVAEDAAETPERVCGEPDPVQPLKPETDLDVFGALDLRVCKIVKCQEIRKSQNCLKLTLDDGLGERVIVSSIKHDYAPEALVGRKIVVVANLKSARITGVESNGMLLAATNSACGCQVLFVPDCVPVGTRIQ